MTRKVLIGCVSYRKNNQKYIYIENENKTSFSLVAAVQMMGKNNMPDLILPLYTFEAREGQSELTTELKREGLTDDKIDNTVTISSTESLSDTLSLFETLYNKLQNGDELYFDITGGFRSYSAALQACLNYLKQTKAIIVKDIFYAKINLDEANAKIYSISYFAKLDEWAIGIQNFIRYGSADYLKELVNGNDASTDLVNALDSFAQHLNLCLVIQARSDFEKVNQSLNDFQQVIDDPDVTIDSYVESLLCPLQNQIKDFLSMFNSDFELGCVDWHLKFHNYQAALTILNDYSEKIIKDKGLITTGMYNLKNCGNIRDSFIQRNTLMFVSRKTRRYINYLRIASELDKKGYDSVDEIENNYKNDLNNLKIQSSVDLNSLVGVYTKNKYGHTSINICSGYENCYEQPDALKTETVSDNFIKNQEYMFDMLELIAKMRKIRNNINHSEYISKYLGETARYVDSGEMMIDIEQLKKYLGIIKGLG